MSHQKLPSAEEAKAAAAVSNSLDELLDRIGTSIRLATKTGRYDCQVDPWLTRRFSRDTVLAAVRVLEATGYRVDVRPIDKTHLAAATRSTPGMVGCLAIYIGWDQPLTPAAAASPEP